MTTLVELSKTLTPEQARRAKERARKAGRRYPNAYDNMRSAGKITKAGQTNPGTPEWKRKAILATNAAGVVAAPAAIGGAYRSARKGEGGIPREIAQRTGNALRSSGVRAGIGRRSPGMTGRLERLARTKVGGPGAGARRRKVGSKLIRGANWFNTPKGRLARASAAGAAAGMVGLQVAQSAGDALAAHENMGKKPKKRAAAAIARQRGEVNKGARAAAKGALKRLKPNSTQQKVIGAVGAGGIGYAAGKERQKAKRRQYDPYYGGY